jgi:hypothetical protein
MSNGIGDGPIESRYHAKMNAIAEGLDEILNDGAKKGERHTGFVLLVFPFNNHDGRCNYISNSERADIKVLLREQLARFEGSPGITGNA